MGLGTTYDAWHGSYTSFAHWRGKIAEAANLAVDWSGVTRANAMGIWEDIPCDHQGKPEPLLILLAHSDCDGEIRPEHAGPIADRLEEILPLIDDGASFCRWREKTQQFIDGLRTAAVEGDSIEFC